MANRPVPNIARGARLVPVLLFVLLGLAQAHAADGVREINQVCATGPGCFFGDGPGWPVTIAAPGSYVLTGALGFNNLLGPPSEHFVEITADDVQLDLGGFAIRCVNALLGTPCTGGAVSAVRLASGVERVRIRNGTIHGLPGGGVNAAIAKRVVVEDLIVSSIGSTGIHTGNESRVERCTVVASGTDGIRVGESSRVEGNTVRDSGRYGILTQEHAMVSDNLVRDSESHGISVSFGSVIRGNTVRSSGDSGIESDSGSCIVHGNVSSSNTIGFDLKGLDGLATDNVADSNTNFGMQFGSNWVFRDNLVGSSTLGGIDGGGNYCGGTPGCP